MSDLGDRTRDAHRAWAAPGSAHDRLIKLAMIVLPSAIGALAAVLIVTPLLARSEISFVLAKDKVKLAKERMRITEALYRGADDKGRPFSLHAGGAVQQTSKVPVVQMNDLSARMTLNDGPALLRAPQAAYDLNQENVRVNGPVTFESANGYRLATRDVGVDLKAQTMASQAPVEGRVPVGTFSGDRLRANLDARTVTLDGHARLHIVQRAVRAHR